MVAVVNIPYENSYEIICGDFLKDSARHVLKIFMQIRPFTIRSLVGTSCPSIARIYCVLGFARVNAGEIPRRE